MRFFQAVASLASRRFGAFRTIATSHHRPTMISNTSSIVEHDPKFAVVYLEEKRLLLDVLKNADPRLLEIARSQTEAKP